MGEKPIIAALLTGLLTLASVAASSQELEDRARQSAEGVQGLLGTEQGLQRNGFEPLATDRPMQTVDGQSFDAQLSCEASRRFLRVTIIPTGTSDIDRVTVDQDRDLDGTPETLNTLSGPFAGVCTNGLIRCDAGTFNNCQYYRYRTTAGALDLAPVTIHELGGCYCFNASCGNSLLAINSQKIVSDIAAGMVETLKAAQPRLTTARVEAVDALTVAYYGQPSGCGTDNGPEQYYQRPNELATAGIAESNRPGSIAQLVLNSPVAAQHGFSSASCEIRRDVPTESLTKNDILRLSSATRGTTFDCGPDCLRFRLGQEGDNYYAGGSCTVFNESAILDVLRPDRVQSLRLSELWFDDHAQVQVAGGIVFTSQVGWGTGAFPAASCERRNRFSATPNVDLSPYARAAASIPLVLRTAVGDGGEGWAFIDARVQEGCSAMDDQVTDGCLALAANTDCELDEETVDGVQTVVNGRTTGLGPLPSSRMIGGGCQVDSGPRAWWLTQRRYRCRNAPLPADTSASAERYQSIHDSFDPATGNFTDRRVLPTGVQLSSENLSLPPAAATSGCIPMCRTRKPRPGITVGDLAAPASALNNTGVGYDFAFKECDGEAHCPLEGNEEEVAPCDCRSNFAQAAALMQTIRMVGKDMVCTAPPP